VSLAACVQADFTPKPIQTITPSSPPTSAAPTGSTNSATPSETPSNAGVKATGSMAIFGEVSKALTGTCATGDSGPTIMLADNNNDFYGKVEATLVLDAAKKDLVGVTASFAEDSEGFAWELAYSSSETVKGTSAKLSTSGSTYTASGKLQSKETRKGKTRTEILPFTIVAKCAGTNW
jgi:hypothetical protein